MEVQYPPHLPLAMLKDAPILSIFLAHLGVEGSQAQAPNGSEEQKGHCDLYEEGDHYAELVQPDR